VLLTGDLLSLAHEFRTEHLQLTTNNQPSSTTANRKILHYTTTPEQRTVPFAVRYIVLYDLSHSSDETPTYATCAACRGEMEERRQLHRTAPHCLAIRGQWRTTLSWEMRYRLQDRVPTGYRYILSFPDWSHWYGGNWNDNLHASPCLRRTPHPALQLPERWKHGPPNITAAKQTILTLERRNEIRNGTPQASNRVNNPWGS
jgi:hypothetical protein